MGRKCAIDGCHSELGRVEDNGVTFHKIPSHPEVRQHWISICRIPAEKASIKVIYVCSRHFLRKDFCNFKGKKYMLRHRVLPSVFPWDKSMLEALRSVSAPSTPSQDSAAPTDAENSDTKNTVSNLDEVIVPAVDSSRSGTMTQTHVGKSFSLNDRVEVLDNNSEWYPARIIEEDEDGNEVLIHFEKFSSKYDEWIATDSPRLRAIGTNTTKKLHIENFEIGERCMASWTGSRKYPAIVTKKLANGTYEILLDDGFVKKLKANRLFKMGTVPETHSSPLFEPVQSTKQERRERKRKFGTNFANLFSKRAKLDSESGSDAVATPPNQSPRTALHVDDKTSSAVTEPANKKVEASPQKDVNNDVLVENSWDDLDAHPEGPVKAWVPKWQQDGRPVGDESSIVCNEGIRKTVIVADPRLPSGWIKHLTQRTHGRSMGKWDTVIIGPENKRFRSRSEVKNYLEENGLLATINLNRFDFSIHRARSIGNRRKKVKLIGSDGNRAPRRSSVASDGGSRTPIVDQNKKSATSEKAQNTSTAVDSQLSSTDLPSTSLNILKIALVDDVYQCPVDGCTKTYRKENLVKMHVKHYHPTYTKYLDYTPPKVSELAYARTLDTNTTPTTSSTTPTISHTPINTTHNSEIIKLLNSKSNDHSGVLTPSSSSKPASLLATPPPSIPSPSSSSSSHGNRGGVKLRELLTSKVAPTTTTSRTSGLKTLLPVPRDSDDLKAEPPAPPPPSPLPVTNDSLVTQSNDVIIEGGRVIKIVRMKQEEIINCTCGYTEEDGLMIQCDLCCCWQHAFCNNIENESQVPEKYVCYICLHPDKPRTSQLFLHDQDWLKHGTLPTASPTQPGFERHQQRFAELKHSHDLMGNLLELKEFMHATKVKLKIADDRNHPKLYLWSKPWDSDDATAAATGATISTNEIKNCKSESAKDVSALGKPNLGNGLDNNIDVIDKESDDSTLDFSFTQNDNMLMQELAQNTDLVAAEAAAALSRCEDEEETHSSPKAPQPPEAAIDLDDCNLNLLRHIKHSQDQIEERLDYLERQIDMLFPPDQPEPYEDDEQMTKTSLTIKLLLKDLTLLQELSQIPPAHKQFPSEGDAPQVV